MAIKTPIRTDNKRKPVVTTTNTEAAAPNGGQNGHAEQLETAKGRYAHAVSRLGGQMDKAVTSFTWVRSSALQSGRHFHDLAHYMDVAGPWPTGGREMDAVRYLAGMHHDVVYHHVDRKHKSGSALNGAMNGKEGFAPYVRGTIEKLATPEDYTTSGGIPGVRLTLRDDLSGQQRALVNAALTLFGHGPESTTLDLNPYGGQNELLSALFAAQSGLDMDIQPKYLLAEMAMIEGTIPFGPQERFPALKQRLQAANAHLPEEQRLSEDEIGRTIETACEMANQDVISFQYPYEQFIPYSRNVLKEMVGINKPTPGLGTPMDNPAEMISAMRNMANFMEGVKNDPKMKIFHTPDGLTSDEQQQAENAAYDNIDRLVLYLRAGAVGIAAATGIAMERNDEHRAPSSLSRILEQSGQPLGDLTQYNSGTLKPIGHEVLHECRNGDTLSSDHKLTAKILRAIGTDGVMDVAKDLNGLDVTDPASVKAFMARLRAVVAAFRAERRDGDPAPGVQLHASSFHNSTSHQAIVQHQDPPQPRIDAATVEELDRQHESMQELSSPA